MKIRRLFLALVAMTFSAGLLAADELSLVPYPRQIVMGEGTYTCDRQIKIFSIDNEVNEVVWTWLETLKKEYNPCIMATPSGLERKVSADRLPDMKPIGKYKPADFHIVQDNVLFEEEYIISITDSTGVVVFGGSTKGVWNGLQTLTQIMFQNLPEKGGKMVLPCLSIRDLPSFKYRGAHLDCCRHFFTVKEVKEYIDIIALHKINVFHWHLTDDHGWRIEIKKYPELTAVGSQRPRTMNGYYDENGKRYLEYDDTPVKGFYTQKEIREIVAYAAARQVTIIPEIEMPGHALSALASYPYLGCRGKDYKVADRPDVFDDVYCLGRESTYEFLEDVLDEVCALFPGEYLHIGGDECPVHRWKECPDCQAKMKEEGLSSERELQRYLIRRIEQHVNAMGKRIIGWDEILECGVTPTATVMSWRGPEGGKQAAMMGNDVVMTPNTHFYFDYYQTKTPYAMGEPYAIGGYLPLEKCYSFDPYEDLDDDAKAHIVGIQANVWTEYIAHFEHVTHMLLPRLAALSEVAWCDWRTSYDEFLERVKKAMVPIYEYHGYVYAPYAFGGDTKQ